MRTPDPRLTVIENTTAYRLPLLPGMVADFALAADSPKRTIDLALTNERFRTALALASPSLSAALTRAARSDEIASDPAEDVRLATALSAYLIRAATRSTPFGAFAGVGRARFTDEPTAFTVSETLNGALVHLLPDFEWLGKMSTLVESQSSNFAVVLNNCRVRRSDRLFFFSSDQTVGAAKSYISEYISASVKVTPLVERLLEMRSWPILLADLEAIVGDDSRTTLDELVRIGVLLPAHRVGPATSAMHMALASLQVQLKNATWSEGGRLFSSSPFRLDDLDSDFITRETRALSSIVDSGSPAAAHMVYSTQVTINAKVRDRALLLGELYIRCARRARLSKLAGQFTQRYEGTTRLVPLLEIMDDRRGLGNADLTQDQQIVRQFDTGHLQLLVHGALVTGQDVVALSDADVDRIYPPLKQDERTMASVEVAFAVAAASAEAVDAGDFILCPTAFTGSSGRGRSLSRFAHFLSLPISAFTQETAIGERRITAELFARPPSARMANVAVVPPTAEYEIAIGCPPSGVRKALSPSELLVGFDNEQGFFLFSSEHDAVVDLVQTHLLNHYTGGTALIRFLMAMARENKIESIGVDTTALIGAPYVPRITWGQICIRLATWTLRLRRPSREELDEQLDFYTRTFKLPKRFYYVSGDNRLLIDRTGNGLENLYLQVSKDFKPGVRFILEEEYPNAADLWVMSAEGEAHHFELVTSIANASVHGWTPPVKQFDVVGAIADADRRRLPLSDVCYLKIYAGRDEIDLILSRYLPAWLSEPAVAAMVQKWFFVRYADPSSHLRLRLFASHNPAWLLTAAAAFASALVRLELSYRFTVDTYERETERYAPCNMDIVEQFFCDNSEIVLAAMPSLLESKSRVAEAAFLSVPIVERAISSGSVRRVDTGKPNRDIEIAPVARRRRLLESTRELETAYPSLSVLFMGIEPARGDFILSQLLHMHYNRCGISGADEAEARAIESATRSRNLQRKLVAMSSY